MIKEKKGLALIVAIMLIVFISIAVLGLSVFIVGWYKQIDTDEREVRCIYNAMAGINYSIYQYRLSGALTNGATAIDASNNFTLSTVSGDGGGGGASAAIIIDARTTTLTNSNRRVSTWTIRNNSASALTINQVTVTWQKTPKTLTGFTVNNVSRWTGSRTTPPAVITVNISIPANTTYSNNQIIFNSSAAGDAGITLSFRMTDGTITSPCTIYPAQASTCVQAGTNLTIKSMGKTTGSNQYRSVQATYNITTGNVSDYDELFATVP